MDMEYKQVHGYEAWGDHGSFGIKILVRADHEMTDAEESVLSNARDQIEAAVLFRGSRL